VRGWRAWVGGRAAQSTASQYDKRAQQADARSGPDADAKALLHALKQGPPGSLSTPSIMHYHIAYLYGEAQKKVCCAKGGQARTFLAS